MTSLNDQIIECMTHILVACKVLAEARETDFDGGTDTSLTTTTTTTSTTTTMSVCCVR